MSLGDSMDFHVVSTVAEDRASRLSKVFADAGLQLFDIGYATEERGAAEARGQPR
jgi:hypothetical protein